MKVGTERQGKDADCVCSTRMLNFHQGIKDREGWRNKQVGYVQGQDSASRRPLSGKPTAFATSLDDDVERVGQLHVESGHKKVGHCLEIVGANGYRFFPQLLARHRPRYSDWLWPWHHLRIAGKPLERFPCVYGEGTKFYNAYLRGHDLTAMREIQFY